MTIVNVILGVVSNKVNATVEIIDNFCDVNEKLIITKKYDTKDENFVRLIKYTLDKRKEIRIRCIVKESFTILATSNHLFDKEEKLLIKENIVTKGNYLKLDSCYELNDTREFCYSGISKKLIKVYKEITKLFPNTELVSENSLMISIIQQYCIACKDNCSFGLISYSSSGYKLFVIKNKLIYSIEEFYSIDDIELQLINSNVLKCFDMTNEINNDKIKIIKIVRNRDNHNSEIMYAQEVCKDSISLNFKCSDLGLNKNSIDGEKVGRFNLSSKCYYTVLIVCMISFIASYSVWVKTVYIDRNKTNEEIREVIFTKDSGEDFTGLKISSQVNALNCEIIGDKLLILISKNDRHKDTFEKELLDKDYRYIYVEDKENLLYTISKK